MGNGIFHSVFGIRPQEAWDSNVREFVGDGTPLLAVPGLACVNSVQIGQTPIPIERDYKFPLNADFSQKVHTTLPQVALDHAEDGTALLLRCLHSNDGVWQKGEKVYVCGDWENQHDANSSPAADEGDDEDARIALRGQTAEELRAQARRLGLVVDEKASKEQVIDALLGM